MLRESPTAFGSDYAESAGRPLAYFRDRATFDPENFIIGAFIDGRLVGSVGALALHEQAGFEVYGREPAALKVAGSNYDEFLMSRKLR